MPQQAGTATSAPGILSSVLILLAIALLFGLKPYREKLAADQFEVGVAALRKQDFELAIAHFNEAIRLDPSKSDYFLERGFAHRNKAAFQSSVADYTESIRLNPTNSVALVGRALAYKALDDRDAELRDLDQAVRLDPYAREPYVLRAILKAKQTNYEESLTDFDQALKIDPEWPFAHNALGVVALQKGDTNLALEAYDKAIRLDSNYARSYFNRGRLHKKGRSYKLALADLEKTVALEPEDARGLNELAWLKSVCPDPSFRDGSEAILLATKACELTHWTNAAYLDTLAAAYAEKKLFKEALKLQDKALKLDPAMKLHRGGLKRRALYGENKPYRED